MQIYYSDDNPKLKDGNFYAKVDNNGNILMFHTSMSDLTPLLLTTAESHMAHLARHLISFVNQLGWRIDQVVFATQVLGSQPRNFLVEDACNSGTIRMRYFPK